GDEDAKSNAETNAEAGDGLEGSAFVDGGGENSEHEEEGSNGFEGHSRDARKVTGKLGSADGDGAPNIIGDDGFQEECRSDRAEDLSNPVEEDVDRAEPLGDPETDSNGGIEMTARDVAQSGNHDGDG